MKYKVDKLQPSVLKALTADGTGAVDHELIVHIEEAALFDERAVFYSHFKVDSVEVILIPNNPTNTNICVVSVEPTDEAGAAWAGSKGFNFQTQLEKGGRVVCSWKGAKFTIPINSSYLDFDDDYGSSESEPPVGVRIKAVETFSSHTSSEYLWYALIKWNISARRRDPPY